jgi:hypothetical protein
MDNRRPTRIHRYLYPFILFSILLNYLRFRPGLITQVDDALPEYMNLLGMICSMCSLMLKVTFKKLSSIRIVILKIKF